MQPESANEESVLKPIECGSKGHPASAVRYLCDSYLRRSIRNVITLSLSVLPLFVLVCSAATVQNTGLQSYTESLWQAQDGLPDQATQAFAQTEDGNLWIGTSTGLVRFDGSRFVAFSRENAPTLPELGVNCFLSAQDGSLWIGTDGGGLVRYHNQIFQRYPTIDGLDNQFIKAIFEARDGTVWAGGDQGLFVVSGSKIIRVDNKNGIPSIFVRAIAEDLAGHLWVGGNTLLEFDGNSSARQFSGPPRNGSILSMLLVQDGTFWVGTSSGLSRLTNSGALMQASNVGAPVAALQESKPGMLWLGTVGKGLYLYHAGKLIRTSPTGLPSRTVQALFEDRERSVWAGTPGGILRLSRTPVSVVALPNSADSRSETIYRDLDGSVWVATPTHLFRIWHGVAKPYVFSGLPEVRVNTLLRDRNGNIWIGTDGSGLLCIRGRRIRRFTTEKGLTNDFVDAILQSRDGSIWVGTHGGVTHIEPGSVHSFDMSKGLAYFGITALFEDRNGGIWVGTYRGLSEISGAAVVHNIVTQALSQEQIWSIQQDAAGVLWIGTSSGLYGFKARTLVHLTTAQGLATNSVYQVLDDLRGSIWLSGPDSISRLNSVDLDEFAEGIRHQVALTNYLDSHDLRSASLYCGRQQAGLVDPNGDLWFPTSKGAIHISVDQITPEMPSTVVINRVSADGQLVSFDHDIVLRPGNERLEISYGAVRLRSQEGLRYRYKMDGIESWNEAITRKTAYYTHLPPGRYRFRVQTFEIGNPNAVSEASIFVVQKPHFYATFWFLACIAFALLTLSILVHRIRLRQLRIRFRAVTEERARLAREMHDTVIQGCVGVSALLEAALEVGPSEESLRRQLLTYATDQASATIEAAREAVWDLRNTSSSITDAGSMCKILARAFQSESGIPVGYSVSGVPFALGESAMHELMMIIKEAFTNAITHGKPTSINIEVNFAENQLRIDLYDNGCGFDLNAALPANGHYGILGMHERVRLLGGELNIESGAAQGTGVHITLPRKRMGMTRTVNSNV